MKKTSGHHPKDLDRSLKRLAGAMLISAFEDLASRYSSRRRDVLCWISKRDRSVFSFEFCCAVVGRDPEEIRQRVRNERFRSRSELGMRIVANRNLVKDDSRAA